MKKSSYCIFLLSLFIIINFRFQNFNSTQNAQLFCASNHPKIEINGNQQMKDFFMGNISDGETLETAFRLENLTINSSSTDAAIKIINTSLFINITNCTILDSVGMFLSIGGVNFQNVSNCNIRNCTFVGNFVGMGVCNSTNIAIQECFFYDNNNDIYFSHTNNSVIESNIFINSYTGVSLHSTDNIIIQLNKIMNETFGIKLYDSNNCSINNNNLDTIIYNGISIEETEFSTISYNEISNVDHQGMFLSDCLNLNVTENVFINCSFDALQNFNSNHTNFWRNHFWIQSNDDVEDHGYNNNWDNGSEGNYWSDYLDLYPDANFNGFFFSIPYEIARSDYVDHFPLLPKSPYLSYQGSYYFIEQSSESLIWKIFANVTSNANYSIYMNEDEVDSGFWNSGDLITIELPDLEIGEFTFKIVVNDGLGNIEEETIIVTIVSQYPIIIQILLAILQYLYNNLLFIILLLVLLITLGIYLKRKKKILPRDELTPT